MYLLGQKLLRDMLSKLAQKYTPTLYRKFMYFSPGFRKITTAYLLVLAIVIGFFALGFFAKIVALPPEITLETQEDLTYFPIDGTLTLKSSTPLQKKSFRAHFTIEPEAEYQITFNSTVTKATITFTKHLSKGTAYTVKLTPGLKSVTGRQTTYEEKFVLNTVDEFEVIRTDPPHQSQYVNIHKHLNITFNYEIARIQKEHLTITPKVEGELKILPNDKKLVFFMPKDRYEYDTVYTVTLLPGILSKFGETLEQPYSFEFKTEEDPSKPSLGFSIGNAYRSKLIPLSFYGEPKINLEANQVTGKSVTYTLYKATLNDLLVYFTYKREEQNSYYREEFNYQIDLGKLTKITAWEGNVSDREIVLPIKEIGIFFLRAEVADIKAESFITVNKRALMVKKAPNRLLFWSVDLAISRSEHFVPITLYNMAHSPTVIDTKTTDENGLGEFETSQRVDFAVGRFRSDKEEDSVVPIEIPNALNWGLRNWYGYGWGYYGGEYSASPRHGYKIFAFTDRPIYKPGDTVYFKGIIRRDDDALYKNLKPAEEVTVKIKTHNKELFEQKYKVGETNSFFGEYKLTQDQETGSFYLYVIPPGESGEDYYYYATSFTVATYRKQEYEIFVDTDRLEYVSGDTIKAKIWGNYLFGQPLSGVKVKYTVYANPFWEERSFSKEDLENSLSYTTYWGDKVGESEVTLNENGQAEVGILADIGKFEESQIFVINAEVKDISENEAVTFKNVIVHKAKFNIFFEGGSYSLQKGQGFKTDILILDHNDLPQPNQSFKYEIKHTIWLQKTIEEQKYPQWVKQENTVETSSSKTDDEGNYHLSYQPKKAGSYTLTVTSRDTRGNTAKASRSFWVTDEELPKYYYSEQQKNIILTSNKDIYNIGETATISVDILSREIDALLTLERGNIYEYRIIDLPEASSTLLIPILAEHSPNIYVSVSTFMGSEYISEKIELEVPANHKELTVKIETDKTRYQPGEDTSFNITTLDHKGQGVSADVSLSLVDKAIYYLKKDRTPDIFPYFYQRRLNEIDSSHSFVGIGDFGGGGGGGGNGGVTREIFADTAYWEAKITTDKVGKATVKVTLPHNLTTWVATSYAATTDTKVGEQTQEILVTKYVVVRPITPRFLTNEDNLDVRAVVSNFTAKEELFEVKLEAEGVQITGANSKQIKLQPNESKIQSWKLSVPRDSKDAKLTFFAQGVLNTSESDKVIVTLPVHHFGYKKTSQKAGEGAVEFKVGTSDSADPENSTYTLYLSPTYGGTITEALEYLAGYPYGCVEQTMSRFYPSVLTSKNYKFLGINKPKLLEKLPDMVKEGVKHLGKLQSGDGGWGWWAQNESDPLTTAYVLLGLTEAKDAGFEIPNEMLDETIEFLDKHQSAEENIRPFVHYVLSFYNRGDIQKLKELNRPQLKSFALAYYVLAAERLEDKDLAEKTLDILKSRSISVGEDMVYWSAEAENKYMGSSYSTTALAIQALVIVEPDSELTEKAIRWLMKNQTGNYWHSTFSTTQVIKSLIGYLKLTEELSANYTFKVFLDGKVLKNGTVNNGNIRNGIEPVVIPSPDIKKDSTLKIEKTGTGKLYYSHLASEFIVLKTTPAESQGLQVERIYRDQTSKEKSSFKVGDLVLVEIKVKILGDSSYHAVIVDPLPSGFEAVNTNLDNVSKSTWDYAQPSYKKDYRWVSQKDLRDEKANLFIYSLSTGENKFMYLARAIAPGKFYASPTSAELMYSPEIHGRGNGTHITITEAP